MKDKRKGWKEGILAKEIRSVSGHSHKVGDIIRYRKYKTYETSNSSPYTSHEFHVLNTENMGLVRTTIIELTTGVLNLNI